MRFEGYLRESFFIPEMLYGCLFLPESKASTTQSSNGKAKPTGSPGKQDRKAKNGKHSKQSHDKHGKHGDHEKHKGKESVKGGHLKDTKHSKDKTHNNEIKKLKHHKRKPTLSEKMTEDKKMADHYRNLLKHPSVLRILEQMEDEGSGSASGSGDHGSGQNFAIEKQYFKALDGLKAKHKSKKPHKKTGLRKTGVTSKSSDVSKLHPVPLSKIDLDLIDALSSGAPSKLIIVL